MTTVMVHDSEGWLVPFDLTPETPLDDDCPWCYAKAGEPCKEN
jgi:hypothetical protein